MFVHEYPANASSARSPLARTVIWLFHPYADDEDEGSKASDNEIDTQKEGRRPPWPPALHLKHARADANVQIAGIFVGHGE